MFPPIPFFGTFIGGLLIFMRSVTGLGFNFGIDLGTSLIARR